MALPSSFLQKLSSKNLTVLLPELSNPVSSESPDTCASGPISIIKPSSAGPLDHDHTYFKGASKKKDGQSRQEMEPTLQFKCGDKVLLMQKGKSVGMGVVAEGLTLHGHAIPQGYIKVTIDYIQPNTAPMLASKFDDEEPLISGQFTVWPASNLLSC